MTLEELMSLVNESNRHNEVDWGSVPKSKVIPLPAHADHMNHDPVPLPFIEGKHDVIIVKY